MAVDILDLALGRGDYFEFGKGRKSGIGRLAPSVVAVGGKRPVEQHGDVAMVAEHQIDLRYQSRQDLARFAIPAPPELAAPIAVERYRDVARTRGLRRGNRCLRGD